VNLWYIGKLINNVLSFQEKVQGRGRLDQRGGREIEKKGEGGDGEGEDIKKEEQRLELPREGTGEEDEEECR
jgi:hypothetical protein